MALLNVLLSGGWRLSSTSDLVTKTFSAQTPLTAALGSLSVFVTQEVVLGTTVSEFRISYAQLSNPQLLMLTATNEVRLNFAGQASSFSAASASVMKFRDCFIMMDTS